MPDDLFVDDIDTAAQVLQDRGYPALADAVRKLIARAERLTELLDEAHDELERHRDGAIRYVPVHPVGLTQLRPACCEGTDRACTHRGGP